MLPVFSTEYWLIFNWCSGSGYGLLSKDHCTSLPGSANSRPPVWSSKIFDICRMFHLFYDHPKTHGNFTYLWGRKDSVTWCIIPNLDLTLSIELNMYQLNFESDSLVLCAVTIIAAPVYVTLNCSRFLSLLRLLIFFILHLHVQQSSVSAGTVSTPNNIQLSDGAVQRYNKTNKHTNR